MTPTLLGRWQSRIFLMLVMGVPITFVFFLLYAPFAPKFTRALVLFVILGAVIIFGLGWDVLYNAMQKFRWDHDWPPFMQWGAAIVEGAFVWIIFNLIGQGLNIAFFQVNLFQFVFHYFTVYALIFTHQHSFMRVFFPRWRFSGGRIIGGQPR